MKGEDKSNTKVTPYQSNVGATRYDTESNLLKTEPAIQFMPTEHDVVVGSKNAVQAPSTRTLVIPMVRGNSGFLGR